MSVFVLFSTRMGKKDAKELLCGPYRVAHLTGGEITVFDGLNPFVLAAFACREWHVHDGMGDRSPAYESVSFLSDAAAGDGLLSVGAANSPSLRGQPAPEADPSHPPRMRLSGESPTTLHCHDAFIGVAQ